MELCLYLQIGIEREQKELDENNLEKINWINFIWRYSKENRAHIVKHTHTFIQTVSGIKRILREKEAYC